METLAIWGEFLGGIGVIISLIFFGFTDKNGQSTRARSISARATPYMAGNDDLHGQLQLRVQRVFK